MSLSLAVCHPLNAFKLRVKCKVPSEGITVILGPSGCGKTTLLRCVAGLMQAHKADIAFNGEVWQSGKMFLPAHKRNVAMVFQGQNLLPHLNVEKNIQYAIKRRQTEGLSGDEIIRLFDLIALKNCRINTLSGGEQQRVALARAVASSPDLLLMDEPLSALDEARKTGLLAYISKIKNQIPIIYVTHSRQEMMRLADHVLLIEGGQNISNGPFWSMMQSHPEALLGMRAKWSVWRGQLLRHEPAYGLSLVQTNGGNVWVEQLKHTVGSDLRLMFNASDVSVSLSPPSSTSILNVLPVVVKEVVWLNASQSVLLLQSEAGLLRALVTHKSVKQLSLSIGVTVFAQIKSVAVLT